MALPSFRTCFVVCLRNARACPQPWLLCHLGLYEFEFADPTGFCLS